jgi:NAD(P)-dependent dehydrogenase (short-subunit alcohol dehydrogenase family)
MLFWPTGRSSTSLSPSCLIPATGLAADTGLAPDTGGRALRDLFASQDPERFPDVVAQAERLARHDADAEFTFGLTTLIYGIERLTGRAGRGRARHVTRVSVIIPEGRSNIRPTETSGQHIRKVRVSRMGSLDGRVAIVTGAGRGIGRSTALLLASEGASVVVNDLGGAMDGTGADVGPAADVVAEIAEAGGKAIANGADISDHAAAEGLIKSAIAEFGRLDVLVNVAGILRDRMIFNMSEQEWDDVIRVHLKGTFNTSKFAAAHWRSLREESAQNRIINFTSVSGLHGAPGQPNYAAAKMGIVGLTWSCANSLAKYGVTCNAVSPAAATRMTDSIPTDRRRTDRPTDEDPRRSPDNVAKVVAYLASERSGWLNGRIVHSAGYEVSLYNNMAPVVRLIAEEPWDLEHLAAEVERSFRPAPGRAV